ncbi:hypothetical protein [Novosphingobium ginsenosidimutans]|uniref:Type II toxin-antitoxin system VapC family toxin n=1 Tax=Novosphingobium ginsenosidimutans TaxID=1176536 RepID=A0A5B8RZC9_9SPHN|nr:hypothetical protein [Novosphingobium ginsenosidimutans]QEA14790.1 hypothetical protein FRF71_00855 [Novosphingobium ginsenosidimutans]
MTPHAVDANAIHQFQEERVNGSPGIGHTCIEAILSNACIALDEEGHCLQEWLQCAGGKFPFALGDWVADQAVHGKIKYYELSSNSIRKHLNSLGIPTSDHKWIRLAIGSKGFVIVTNDIDFFDPSKKNATAKVKDKIKASGGPCSKMLSKCYGITVRWTASF